MKLDNKKTFTFTLDKINKLKVYKTVRGSVKKGIFYLGLKLPYEVTEHLVNIQNDPQIKDNFKLKLGDLYEIFLDDAKIRFWDDVLDNILAKKRPLPFSEMNEAIKNFKKDMNNQAEEVSKLFRLELDLLKNNKTFNKNKIEKRIKLLIKIKLKKE